MKTLTTIPAAPREWWILGHIPALLREPLAFFRLLPACGDLVRIRLGPAQAVVVCDPELTWQVLSHDRLFDKGGLFIERAREVFGDGLGTCPHSVHRRQRRLVQPAFHADRLPRYAQVMNDRIDEVVGSWRPGQVLDVLAEMTTITSTTTAAMMFTDALPTQLRRRALDDLTTVLSGIVEQMLIPPALGKFPTPRWRRYRRARIRLRRTLQTIIVDRRTEYSGRDDLLSVLLSTRDGEADSRGLSDSEILDQVVSFFFAGTDTTASTLAWAFHLLAGHTEIRDRLHAEVDEVLAGRPVTYADLPRLELTRRIIAETLRLWPAGWMFTRTVTAETRLGNHLLPAGTTVVYSAYLLHHHPGIFEQPDRFDPDRWLPERARSISRHAYIPFGGEPGNASVTRSLSPRLLSPWPVFPPDGSYSPCRVSEFVPEWPRSSAREACICVPWRVRP
ncbi:cytochrome P450 [Nocardia sp. NPDC004568]|uniref:cytochrome P450 n=1 Tax=Nocardia sp. NPDC004568 TaxID=3154551 RepID=UPI0033B4ADBF